MTRKSIGQIFSIIASVAQDDNVNTHEIKWVRKEIKSWFRSLFFWG